MMVVKFTYYSSIIHQILSSSHFSLSKLNLYRKIDDKKSNEYILHDYLNNITCIINYKLANIHQLNS